ncbi:SDR family NAD(P)-dependent oxidoreductase [Candidatus Puniceispirillum sp.]|nr:SDR family NAD(P)-dependent oxidoreductase [Candidatus Puniceispirillum sp.]
MKTAFIFGLGYVGVPLARALEKKGWRIRGTTRTPSKLSRKNIQNWKILPFETERPLTNPKRAFEGVDVLISTITAIDGSDPVLDAHAQDLAAFSGWAGYVSATSVYPDMPNGICYEDTPVAPATARGRARIVAEARWQSQFSAEIFRAAGIYGPGRSPFDALRNGTARIIEQEGQVFNRIHVADICQIITTAIEQPRPGRIINMADQKPAPQGDVVRYAASLIGVTPPNPLKLEDAKLSAMAESFYVSRRRVGSHVIKPELGLDLMYPNYETGLAAILAKEH